MRHSRANLASATLTAMAILAAGCGGSTAGRASGGTTGGSAVGGLGGPPAPTIVTEVDVCNVNFSPVDPITNNQAKGMTWGGGQIIFNVSIKCPKPMTRGTLTYAIIYTGYSNPQQEIDPPKFNLAGIQAQDFPVVEPCKAGNWIFEYQWEATISGSSDSKQDANTSYGVLLTSANCK